MENFNCKYMIVFFWNIFLIYGVVGKLVLFLRNYKYVKLGNVGIGMIYRRIFVG